MAVDTNNLIQNVCDYFVNLYNSSKGDGSGSTFLSFQKVGPPITQSDFKLPGQSGFSQALATEYFSHVANYVPCLTGTAQDTAKTVDDFYQMILLGAQPVSAADADLNFFAQLKSVAQKKFDDMTLRSLSGEFEYHPCYPDPMDWYDPSNVGNWITHTFSMEKPAPPGTPPPSPVAGASAVWRIGPSPAHIATAVQSYPKIAVKMTPTVRQALPITKAAPMTAAKPVIKSMAHAAPVAPSALAAHIATPAAFSKTVVAKPMVSHVVSTSLYRTVVFDPNINIAERAALQRAILQHAPAKPVSSDKFSLSFSYCMVRVQRPWFYEPFLFNKNWYIPSYKEGSFSTATIENNDGVFPAIPIALVVIKDLAITANWSDSDAKVAQNAMAFGPFSLAGSRFENNTLSCTGMQVIAWIFNVLPFLPSNADPSLVAAKPAGAA